MAAWRMQNAHTVYKGRYATNLTPAEKFDKNLKKIKTLGKCSLVYINSFEHERIIKKCLCTQIWTASTWLLKTPKIPSLRQGRYGANLTCAEKFGKNLEFFLNSRKSISRLYQVVWTHKRHSNVYAKVILEYENMALLWSHNDLCLHTSRVDFGGVWKVENKNRIFLKLCGGAIWVVTDRLKPVCLPARASVPKCRLHEHAKSGQCIFGAMSAKTHLISMELHDILSHRYTPLLV